MVTIMYLPRPNLFDDGDGDTPQSASQVTHRVHQVILIRCVTRNVVVQWKTLGFRIRTSWS